jgi:ribose transport system substrate-binding protein
MTHPIGWLRWSFLSLLVLTIFGLASCRSPSRSGDTGAASVPTPATATGNEKPSDRSSELYVEVCALTQLPYFIDHRLGMEAAGRELGVRAEFVGPADYDMTAMIATLEQTLARRPAGILVVGFDAALKPAIDRAVGVGVPVITLDSDVPGSKRLCFIGTGNYAAGVAGAKAMADATGDKGKVAILTKTGQPNLEDRVRGYREELARHPGIRMVGIGNTSSDPTAAASAAAAFLQRHPDLAGIGCVEAAGGIGAGTAVREAGRAGKVKIVAMDRDNGTLDMIRSGVIHASIAQKTALMSYLGTKLLYGLKRGAVKITTDDAKAAVTPLPANIDTGILVITRANASYFYHR